MLEAVGSLGVEHAGQHDKTSGADWSPVDTALLSICFCGACAKRLSAVGVDPTGAAMAVRDAVGLPVASVEEAIDRGHADLDEQLGERRVWLTPVGATERQRDAGDGDRLDTCDCVPDALLSRGGEVRVGRELQHRLCDELQWIDRHRRGCAAGA